MTWISKEYHVLAISAPDADGLKYLVEKYIHQLENSDNKIQDLCFKANTSESHFNHRLAIVGKSPADFKKRLARYQQGQEQGECYTSAGKTFNNKVAFLFTGQGSQYPGMAKELYKGAPVFKKELDRCDKLFFNYTGESLTRLLYSDNIRQEELNQPVYSQPIIFSIQYALYKLWLSWGVRPAVVIGHSIGEYAAACTAGVFSLEEAVRVVAARGKILQQAPDDGQMVGVLMSEAKAGQMIAPYKNSVSIAAVNSPGNVTLSGSRQSLQQVIRNVKQERFFVEFLDISHPFHSIRMEPFVEKFKKEIGGVTFSKPNIPIISSITGDVVGDEMCHADYWCTHICKTVRFSDAVKTAEKQGMGVFVELGGTAALSGLAADCMADKDAVFLPSLRKGVHPWKQMSSSLAQLYSRGINIDWVHFHNPYGEKQLVSPSCPPGQDRKELNKNQENIMEIKQDKKTTETPRNSNDLTGTIERQLALIKQQYQATFEIMTSQLTALEEPLGLEYKPESQREDLLTDSEDGKDQKLKERYRPNFRSIKLEIDDLTGEQQKFLKEFIGRYTAKTKKSRDYIRAHRRVMSDWLSMLNFRLSLKELAYPIVSQRSAGARIWDLDGNEYIDIAIGYGANYFGHKPGFIQEALKKQLQTGLNVGAVRNLAGEVARLISQLTRVERVVFSNTGTEAVMTAVRIARTVTGRDKIVRFAGSFHGTFDGILAEADEHGTYPISPGTPQGMVKDTIVLPYVSPESLEKIEDWGEELAAVLVEPVQSRKPDLEPREFLQRLREITSRVGAALIFDDIYIGFRLHQGGSRAYFDVEPDIVTYGKIIGGGLPIGIVAGKKEFLDAIDGGYWSFGDSSVPAVKTTFYGGTFLRHPLVLAASHAALKYMKEQGPQLQERVNQKGQFLADEVNAFFKTENVPVRLTNAGSSFRFESFGKYHQSMLPLEMELFYYLLTYKGIYLWERRTCSLSTVHTDEDIRFIIAAVKESIKELRQGGFTFSTKE